MARPAHNDATNGVQVEALEQRITRLEDAVAAIQDTQLMEDRVVERVVQRVEHAPLPLRESSGLIVNAARMLMPRTIDAVPENGSTPPAADGAAPPGAGSPWFVLGIFHELRWILRMLTDYRYRMSWTGRVVLLAAVVLIVLSYFIVTAVPLIGGILDRIVLVFVAIVTYKAMTREVQQYRELMARVWGYR
jgi:hypothetical protein